MDFARLLRHLLTPPWRARRAFPQATLDEIEVIVAGSEIQHEGELRFVVEGALDLGDLLAGTTARARAIEVFARLGVWDTAHNSGVLIYVQLVDRRVEIVADRGIAARVPQERWEAICRDMEAAYRNGRFASGSRAAIARVTALLVEHFPVRGANPNELPDRPVVL